MCWAHYITPPRFSARLGCAGNLYKDLVWRNATVHGSPENILILWYIGDGWECELCLHFIKGENI